MDEKAASGQPTGAEPEKVDLEQLTKSIEALTPEQHQEARDRLRDFYRPDRDRIVTEKHKELQAARAELEALRAAGLSESERIKRDLEVARAEAAERAAALEDREAELVAREIAEAVGIAPAFRSYLKTTDRDEAMKRAKEIARAIESAVSERVKAAIASQTHVPAGSSSAPASQLTREQLRGMTPAEVVEAVRSGRVSDLLAGSQ